MFRKKHVHIKINAISALLGLFPNKNNPVSISQPRLDATWLSSSWKTFSEARYKFRKSLCHLLGRENLRSPSIVFAEPEVTLRFVFKNAY
jgi:hypothetical protein